MKLIVLFFTLLTSQFVLAKSGEKIPIPIVSYHEAHDLAFNELLTEKNNIDPRYAPAKEYIVYSIKYQNLNRKWLWVIKFIHPRVNDHTVIYHVDQNKVITLYSATE